MAQGRNELPIDIVIANIRAAQKQIESLASKPYTINIDVKGKNFTAPLGKIKGQLGEFEKSLEASNARVIAFGASASAIYAVEKALSESVKAAVEVEKALVDINVILNLSSKSLSEFGTSLFTIAKNTGNTFSTVATAATELSRQGLGVTETLKRTQDALILTRLSGLGAAESVNAITASLNGFQKAALSSTDIINKLAAVDANFAVSSGDLAEAIKRVGSSAEDAGVSFDQLLAIVTSAQQITARGGAVIGNSFKTIFTRLERPKVLDALQQLGIETQTLAGNTRPVIDILTELAKKYDTLNDRQKSSIAEQVGGVFQINILKAALGDLNKEYSIYSQALSVSTGASDEAIKRNEQLNTTLAATLNKTLANLTAAGAKIGELSLAPALKKVMGGLNTALESFTGGDSEDVGNKIGEGLLRGLGNFLSGPGLIVGARALFTIFERLTTFSADAIKTLLGLNTHAAEQLQIQEQITTLLSKNPQIIAQIASGETTVEAVQLSILDTIKAQTLAMQQQVTLAKSLAASLSAAGVSIGRTGVGKGTLQARAGGFVPNLFGEEERNARSMGAVNPRAQISQGTIGGQKFIKNNKEIEVVGAGRNGDSAVIPTYGSIGNQRQKEYYDKLKFLGFVPNFARQFNFASPRVSNGVGMIYPKLGAGVGPQEGIASYGDKKVLLKFNAAGFDAKNIRKPKDVDLETQLGNKIVEFTNSFAERIFQPVGELQSAAKIKSTSELANVGGFGSILGSVFETAVDLATGRMNEGRGPNDRIDFADPNPLIRNLFYGIKSNQLEAKSSLSEGNRDSVAQKMLDIGAVPQSVKDFLGDKYEKNLAEKALKEKEAAARKAAEQGQTVGKGRKISSKKRASGFIPNFSSVKDAMETEKKMGGNPALDFQEGIGLYVRDKNTQPNFSAVKKDHPEGINNAIKNSKIAQETLARGFIPNFAPSGGAAAAASAASGVASSSTAITAQNVAMVRTMKGLQAKMLGASFAFSTLQGVVETFNRDGKSAFGNIISGISQGASTFSSIASVIPGQVGLVVAAIVGVAQAIDSIKDSFETAALNDIIKNGELASEGLSKLNDASQAYAQAFEKLTEITANTSSSAQDIIKAQQKLQEALLDLPAQYRAQFASAKNLTELQDVMGQALDAKRKEAMQKQNAADLAKDVEKQKGSRNFVGDFVRDINDKLGLTGKSTKGAGAMAAGSALAMFQPLAALAELGTNFGKDKVQGKKDKGIFTGSPFGEQLATERATNIFKGLNPQFGKDLASGVIDANQSSMQWIATLKNYGLSADELSSVLAILNNSSADGVLDLKMLTDALVGVARTTAEANDNLNNLSEARKKQIAQDEQDYINKRKQLEAEKAAAEAIEIRTAATLKASMEERKLATYRQSSMNKIATEAEKSALQTKQPFITEESMARGNAQITANQANNDYGIKVRESNDKAIEEMSNQLTTSIDNQIEELKKSEGRGGEAVTKEIEKLKGARGQIGDIIKGGGTADQVRNKFQELAGKGNLELPDLQKLAVQNGVIIEDARAEAAKAEVDRQEQIQLAKDQLKAQLQQLRDQKLLKGGGGIQGFLNPETLKDPLEKFTQGLEGMQAGKKTGLGMMEARGSLQAGMSLQELTGGFGSDKLNKSLRGQVVPQMAEQKRTMFLDMAAQAQAAGNDDLAQVARDAASEAQAMAEKQFDNQFKLEDNVAGIYDLLKNEMKGGNSREGQTQTGVEKGIEQASATMAAQQTASAVGTTAPTAGPFAQVGESAPTIAPNTPEGALWKQVKAANPYQNPAATPQAAEQPPLTEMQQGLVATGMPVQQAIDYTTKDFMVDKMGPYDTTGAGPASATPVKAGTLAADKTANTHKEKSYKQKSKDEFTSADWKAKEKDDAEAWNKEMAASTMASFGYQPQLGSGPSISDYWNSGKSSASEGEGIGKKKIGPIGTPLANTPTTTTGQVKEYTDQNNSKQQQLLQQRNALAGKNDPESNRQRAQLDKNLNTLRDQQKTAGTAGKEAGMRERPAQEIERQQKGRPLSSNQNDQGQTDQTKKLTEATEKNTKATSESKSEVNVAFTPISVEFKGSIETANDELSQKTMDAIQKAVEQIAPGIMAKLKGPPTEAKA